MGHKQVFDTIVYRRYLPKIKAYKEKWNHQKQEIGFPLVTAYSLNEKKLYSVFWSHRKLHGQFTTYDL